MLEWIDQVLISISLKRKSLYYCTGLMKRMCTFVWNGMHRVLWWCNLVWWNRKYCILFSCVCIMKNRFLPILFAREAVRIVLSYIYLQLLSNLLQCTVILAHCGGKQDREQKAAGGLTKPTWCRPPPPTSMWRYTCSWIDRSSGGPFQYKTLSSTRRITHSGTEGFHINENARVVNVLRLLL